MQAEAQLTNRGQVTIPQQIQQALDAREGDILVFETGEDGVHVRVRHPSSFRKYAGINRQGAGQSIADIVAEIREGTTTGNRDDA